MQYSTVQYRIYQLQNAEHFMFCGRNVRNTARRVAKTKFSIAITKAAFNTQKTFCTSKLDLNVRKKPIKCYICSTALYGTETWTLRRADQKYLESFEMWSRSAGVSWTDRAETKKYCVKEARNILQTMKRRKTSWNGYMLGTNCLINTLLKER